MHLLIASDLLRHIEVAESRKKDEVMKFQIPAAKHGLAVAALILVSPIVVGSEAGRAQSPEVVRVTAPKPSVAVVDSSVETNAAAVLEAIGRRLEQDLKDRLDAIAPARIDLAMAEIPSRG